MIECLHKAESTYKITKITRALLGKVNSHSVVIPRFFRIVRDCFSVFCSKFCDGIFYFIIFSYYVCYVLLLVFYLYMHFVNLSDTKVNAWY